MLDNREGCIGIWNIHVGYYWRIWKVLPEKTWKTWNNYGLRDIKRNKGQGTLKSGMDMQVSH